MGDEQGRRDRRLVKTVRNPQRRPVSTVAAGRRVPTREMPAAPGRLVSDEARYQDNCYAALATSVRPARDGP